MAWWSYKISLKVILFWILWILTRTKFDWAHVNQLFFVTGLRLPPTRDNEAFQLRVCFSFLGGLFIDCVTAKKTFTAKDSPFSFAPFPSHHPNTWNRLGIIHFRGCWCARQLNTESSDHAFLLLNDFLVTRTAVHQHVFSLTVGNLKCPAFCCDVWWYAITFCNFFDLSSFYFLRFGIKPAIPNLQGREFMYVIIREKVASFGTRIPTLWSYLPLM